MTISGVTLSSDARMRSLQSAILSFGVSDAVPAKADALTDDRWQALLTWAVDQRVVGLLRAAAGQLVALSPRQDQQLRAANLAATTSSLHVESSIGAVADALSEASIDWRLLKGAATAHLLYSEAGQRTIGDVDLLVRPAELHRTLEALKPITSAPAIVPHGQVRAKAQKEYQITDGRGVEIDLHQAIEGSLLVSRLPIDALFAQPQQLNVAGRSVETMSMPALFVHAVLHLTSVGAQFSTAPDIARLAHRCGPLDPLFAELLVGRGARLLFGYGLTMASEITPLSDEWQEYLARHSLSRAERYWLDWTHHNRPRLAWVNLLTGKQRARRFAETLWPSTDFLAHEEQNRSGHLARLVKKGLGIGR